MHSFTIVGLKTFGFLDDLSNGPVDSFDKPTKRLASLVTEQPLSAKTGFFRAMCLYY